MSMASYEPDWDAGTENAWEEYLAKSNNGDLCGYCRMDAPVPDDPSGLCEDCLADVIGHNVLVELGREDLA